MSYYRLLGLPLALGVILFSGVYIYIHATTATPPDQNQPSKTATSTSVTSSSTPEVTLPPLAEQVGRLFIVGHWAGTPIASTTALIQQYHVGGVIIMSAPEDPNDIKGWIKEWQEVSDVPLMIAIDQEGGTVSRLKGPDFIQTAQPDIVNAEQAFSVAKQRGAELAALGINTNFAPVIETSVNPAGFLYERTFRDPDLIPLLGKAMLNGYSASGITGVIKHYPGHEDEPADSHVTLPIVQLSGTTFREHADNFNELISYGLVKAIMTAHVLIPSIDADHPATLSKKILTGELREKQHYDGVIITDDMTMDAIDEQFSTEAAAVLALNAGADMILFAAEPERVTAVIPYVLQAVDSGEIPESIIEQHYQRVSRLER